MKTEDVIGKLAEELNVKKSEAKKIWETVFKFLANLVMEEDSVRTPIGTFKVTTVAAREARKGHNPRTGEEIEIPAKEESKKISYKMNTEIKDQLNA